MQKKVIIGMSGGVDSSVAAYLLKKKGYHVEALFMKNWEEDDNNGYCASKIDLSDVQSVCKKLDIKLHTVNFSSEYWNNVFEHFLFEYKSGRTPNPDVLCNKEIKFKVFLKFSIEDLGADYIATGHYVRTVNINGRKQLLRGLDNSKDQSYFLYTLSHKQISKSLFPIGQFKKTEVRKIAESLELITARKKDSTGICFIGKRRFREFLNQYLPIQLGKIVTVQGNVVGEHQGLMYYTIGQRRGIGIGGIKNGNGNPWYVVDKKVESNTLVVAQGHNNCHLMSVGLIAKQLYLVSKKLFTKGFRCTAKTRYRQDDVSCTIANLNKNQIEVYFDDLVFAVTPGQSVVFYKNEICLGGGIIEKRLPMIVV